MAYKYQLVAALVLLAASLALSFDVKDCTKGTPQAKLISFAIDSCPEQTAKRCNFHIGKNVTVSIELEPTASFKQANIKMGALILFSYIPLPFPGPRNACGNYGLNCPTSVGQRQTVKFTMPIDKRLHPLRARLRFEFVDQNSSPIICGQFPINLKRP